MAKKEEGYWFTTDTGVHIHVNPGESKEDALKRKFGKDYSEYKRESKEIKKADKAWESHTDNKFGSSPANPKNWNYSKQITQGTKYEPARFEEYREKSVSAYTDYKDVHKKSLADDIAKTYQNYESAIKNKDQKSISHLEKKIDAHNVVSTHINLKNNLGKDYYEKTYANNPFYKDPKESLDFIKKSNKKKK